MTAPLLGLAAFAALAVPSPVVALADTAQQALYALGDRVAANGLITSGGRPFAFDDGSGRTTALSFIYTQCRDADGCPTITARFVKLAERVDPRRIRLVLVTIAPRTDAPPVLRRYAAAFGPSANRVTFVTGDARAIAGIASRFEILGSERDPDGALDHAERLIVLDGTGRVADRIDGTTWALDDVATAVETVAGLTHAPIRLLAVRLTWAVEHRCGLPGTNVATSLHHDAVALLLMMPTGPLAALLVRERRRRRVRATPATAA